jgi:hypothetical protein
MSLLVNWGNAIMLVKVMENEDCSDLVYMVCAHVLLDNPILYCSFISINILVIVFEQTMEIALLHTSEFKFGPIKSGNEETI